MNKRLKRERKRHQSHHNPTRVPIVVLLPPAVERIIRILAADEQTSSSRIVARMIHDALGIGYLDDAPAKRGKRGKR